VPFIFIMVKLENKNLQNLVEVIDFAFNLVEALKIAKANDGVVDFKDWSLLFPLIGDAGVAYEGIESILKAWPEASQEDRNAVVELFNTRFTLENKVTEAKIEKAVKIVTLVLELVID
jgi:hypothetical protein